MRNTSIKIDYLVGLIADAVRDYSIRGNDEVFQSIIIELKKHFENCSEEIMDILSLCVKMYSLEHSESAELVITSPDSFKVKSRKTKDVIYSLVKDASKSITITGYSISDFFKEMLDVIIRKSQQGVFVKLFVNDIGNQKAFERLCSYKSKFLKIYNYPKRDDKMAALHAKVIVVDQAETLITSANLSYHGQEGNIELGTRIVSPEIAKQVDDVFTKLLFSKVFIEV